MKADDLSKLLRQAAVLLDFYKGKELNYVLDDLIKQKSRTAEQKNRGKAHDHENLQQEKARLEEFAAWTDKATLQEIETAIQSEGLFAISENIRTLANMVGLKLGKRQGRDASIQTLLSYLDRTRVHRVISGRNNPTVESAKLLGSDEQQASDGSKDTGEVAGDR